MEKVTPTEKWKRIDPFIYDPDTPISKGNFGTVYKAYDTSRQNKLVAVKVISSKKFMNDPALYDLFMREIAVLRQIKGPHVVEMIDVKRSTNNLYIFMQYCNQGTLETKMKSGHKFTVGEALKIVQEIALAFLYLEKLNILSDKGNPVTVMHRDIKPANILFHKGKVKLADFGFAKLVDSVDVEYSKTILGTPFYMSPQILCEEEYSQKCDIWATGIVFYQLLFGKLPWNASSISELYNMINDKPLKFPSNINKDLKTLVETMLCIDETERVGWKDIFNHPAMKILETKVEKEKEKEK